MKTKLEKYLNALLIISFLNFVGCYSSKIITKNDVDDIYTEIDFSKEIYITTNDYVRYHFLPGEYIIKNDTLFAQGAIENSEGASAFKGSIPINDITSIEQNKPDALNTTGLILSILAVGTLVLGIIWINAIEDALFPN